MRCEGLSSFSDFVVVITDLIILSIELPVEMDFVFDNRPRVLIRDRNVQALPIGSLCHMVSISNLLRCRNFVTTLVPFTG
jgi:hypothetical protein